MDVITLESIALCKGFHDKVVKEILYYIQSKKKTVAFEVPEGIRNELGHIGWQVSKEMVKTALVKAEETSKYGNAFFEMWKDKDKQVPGWMLRKELKPSFLFYYFDDKRVLYTIPWDKLRYWFFNQGNLRRFAEKPQGKWEQEHVTWGRPVPIPVLKNELTDVGEYML